MDNLLEEFNFLDFCDKDESDKILDTFPTKFFRDHYDPNKLDYFLTIPSNDEEEQSFDSENKPKNNIKKIPINFSYMAWYLDNDIEAGINWYIKHYDVPFIDRLALYFVRQDLNNPLRKKEIYAIKKLQENFKKNDQLELDKKHKKYLRNVEKQKKNLTTIQKGEFVISL